MQEFPTSQNWDREGREKGRQQRRPPCLVEQDCSQKKEGEQEEWSALGLLDKENCPRGGRGGDRQPTKCYASCMQKSSLFRKLTCAKLTCPDNTFTGEEGEGRWERVASTGTAYDPNYMC